MTICSFPSQRPRARRLEDARPFREDFPGIAHGSATSTRATLTLGFDVSICLLVTARSMHLDAEYERAVCQRYGNRIRAYGLCHLRDAAAAEDLVQQVLLIVLNALREGKVDDVDHLEKYVFGTCRNAAMSMRRGEQRQRRIADEAASKGLPEGYEPSWELVDRGRLDGCLERLEARARAVILATFVDERDADDVGRSMGLSAGNVRVIRHRALVHLYECMEGGAEA
jgi:RNA polymerase sigma-70 factor, ECF subfamily